MTGYIDINNRIRQAIDSFDIELARVLLREALKNPTAEVYYYAYEVAISDRQRRDFLSKALELDPGYPPAVDAMRKMQVREEPFKMNAGPAIELSNITDIGQPAPLSPPAKLNEPVQQVANDPQPAPVAVQQVYHQNIPVSPPVNVGIQTPPVSPSPATQVQPGGGMAGAAVKPVEAYNLPVRIFIVLAGIVIGLILVTLDESTIKMAIVFSIPWIILTVAHWRSKLSKKRLYFQVDNFLLFGSMLLSVFLGLYFGFIYSDDYQYFILMAYIPSSILSGLILLFAQPRPAWLKWD